MFNDKRPNQNPGRASVVVEASEWRRGEERLVRRLVRQAVIGGTKGRVVEAAWKRVGVPCNGGAVWETGASTPAARGGKPNRQGEQGEQ